MLEDAHIMQLSQGFSRLSRAERFRRLEALGVLTAEDIAFLEEGGVRRTDLAENLIENVILCNFEDLCCMFMFFCLFTFSKNIPPFT